MRLKGKDIALYRSIGDGNQYKRIALSLSCDVSASCDMQEFSSFLSGRAKRFRAGRYSWTVNSECVVADDVADGKEMLLALKTGTRLRIAMSVGLPDGTVHAVSGWVLVAGWSEGAPLSGMATYKVSFQGDGELEIL